MARRPPNRPGSGPPRSDAQRFGSAALTYVMSAWEGLTEREYLTWRTAARSRRMQGVTYFKQVNLRRVRRGDPVVRLPQPSSTRDPRPILRRLVILNRGGNIALALELHRVPSERTSVWASRPCNRGAANPRNCPRLGWLPARRSRLVDITRLYFEKHGPYLRQQKVRMEAKRIFVRLRLEVDEGASLYEQVNAVVPPPEGASNR